MDCLSKAALYIRVSTEEQAAEGQSVPAQIETLTQYCKLYNIEIYEIYKDLGISGKDTQNRPGLIKMLQDAKAAKFNMVLVWKISRLSRNLKDLLMILEELEKSHIAFSSYSEKFDTASPVGRMTIQLLGSIAEFERNTIIDNVKLGLQEYAHKGGKTGTVLGYDNVNRQLIVNPQEAEIVKLIYLHYTVDKMSMSEIASNLNDHGFRTKRNKTFNKDAVSVILGNPVYIGINRHNIGKDDEYQVKGVHQPIIDEATWMAAQRIKESNKKRRPPRSKQSFFLLSGKLVCPFCGKQMHGFTSKGGSKSYRYYRCNGCKCICNAENIHQVVLLYLKNLLLKEKIIGDVLLQPSLQSKSCKDMSRDLLQNELKRSETLMDKYILLLQHNEFNSSTPIVRKIKELETKITELQSKLDKITSECKVHVKPFYTPEDYIACITKIFSSNDEKALKKIIDASINSVTLFQSKTIKDVNLRFNMDSKL